LLWDYEMGEGIYRWGGHNRNFLAADIGRASRNLRFAVTMGTLVRPPVDDAYRGENRCETAETRP